MRRCFSISLAVLLIFTGVISPASGAAKPIKTNFTNMTNLLGALKAKGVNCTSYSKTPAEYVIEEGICQIRGVKVGIVLWPTTNYARQFVGALKKMTALTLPAGSESYIFYTNNYTLDIDGIYPDMAKAKKVANVIQKKLGIKYVVGKAKKIGEVTTTNNSTPSRARTTTPTPTPTPSPIPGSWTAPFSFNTSVKDSKFSYRPISVETGITTKVCADSAKKELEFPDNYRYILDGELCPQSESGYSADKAKIDDYAKFTFEYKNETEKIGYPGDFSVFFKIADSQGNIYEPVILSDKGSDAFDIDAVPGASVITFVYFQLPKTFKKEGSKLEVYFLYGDTLYFTIP